MMPSKFSGSPGRRVTVPLGVVAAVALVVTGCSGSTPPQPTTKVERGTVSTRVSASGALASITAQNLGFPKGAQLKEIDVKPGDTVQPGQVLAREDNFAFNQLLNQQQAQLNNQQAQLNRLISGNTVQQAQRSLDQANQIVDATRKNVDAQLKLDDTTIKRTQDQQDNANRQLQEAQRNLSYCRNHAPTPAPGAPVTSPLGGSMGSTSGTPGSTAQTTTPGAPPVTSPLGGSMAGTPGLTVPAPSFGNRNRDGVLGGNPQSSYSAGEGGADPCMGQVATLNSARTAAIQAKTANDQARKQKKVDDTQGRVSIENARQSVITAQNNLDTASNDRPANIDAQRALVDNARAAVAMAQRDVDNTVLYAPVAGTVSAINGVVNEFVGPETGLTTQAPGTNAAIPGVGAAATSSQNQISVSTNGSRNSGTFITLNNVKTFQVVVPFEESDAAKVAPNLPVEVNFDAIPDLNLQGRVIAVSPTGTDISGVTNYYATIVLTQLDPRLRDGQTAQVGVLTTSKDNVLVVPNNAVIKQGGQSFVSTPGPDGQPVQVPFQPGLVGDDKTEVVSGLREGQQILLPQAQVSPGSGSAGGRGGGGGGGGGGVGGGGRGGG